MIRFFFIFICFQFFAHNTSYAQSTFQGGNCGIIKWDFIGSYRDEGYQLETIAYLRDSLKITQLQPICELDSSSTFSPNTYLVVVRTVLDHDNSYWNDTIKKLIIPRKEVFRDSILIDPNDPEIIYHFWLDKNKEGFEMPPKKDVAWVYLNGEINYNKGLGFSPGVGIHFEGDLGDISHALFGISLNGEFNYHQDQWIYGGKLTGEIHFAELFDNYIPIGAKFSYWYLTNGNETCSKLTAEAGFSLFGLVYLMAGYNFNLNNDSFSSLEGWRFSFGLRKEFFISRIRKDAKYHSNIANEIKRL